MPLHRRFLNILARHPHPQLCIEKGFFEFKILRQQKAQPLRWRINIQGYLAVKSA
ncbi:TPA: hypothetical protein ACF660_004437 [Salmonella enterica]|uniref:Uncharacterized protein n=1 Tax=Salmonella schwarzengrund (strain CVM19633) TaxID=439843 RepID=A0A0N1TV77_SALSV|nr:hypothetical protein SeSA_A0662 [Salmonella enterica subsp. enterica serovar Schwarzengrund str. CVM19633]EDY29723.1 hypothetical protein SeSB_A0850 [Salmonella enterica subsp. enterica serovar Schwarzengrund str. SL480]